MIDVINDADGFNRSRCKRAIHIGGHIKSLPFWCSLLCQCLKDKIEIKVRSKMTVKKESLRRHQTKRHQRAQKSQQVNTIHHRLLVIADENLVRVVSLVR
jgi:hypothetical protein